MPIYRVKKGQTLLHDGDLLEAGATIELSEDAAKPLVVTFGVLEPEAEVEAETEAETAPAEAETAAPPKPAAKAAKPKE